MPQQQVATITKVQSDLKNIFEIVKEIKTEFGGDAFDTLKNLLSETLKKLKKCNTIEEKVFAFMETLSAYQPVQPTWSFHEPSLCLPDIQFFLHKNSFSHF